MPVLGLDTSTRTQSVAIVSEGRVLAERSLRPAASHSDTLVRMVEAVLSECSLRPSGLTAVAVTSGPGSFTGVRVGMATAKGLALAAGKPLAGFSTLRILAEALALSDPAAVEVCALIDAGRAQVYRGIWRIEARADGAGPRLLQAGEETVCAPGEVLAGLGPGCLVGGDGAERYREVLGRGLPPGGRLVGPAPILAPVAALAAEALARAGRLSGRPLVPNYVRPPDALRGPAA